MPTITTRAPTNATPASIAPDQAPKTPDTEVTRGRSKSPASPEKLAGLKRSVSAGGARPNITASAGSGSRPRRASTGSAAVPSPAEMKRIAQQFHQEFDRLVAAHPDEFEFLRTGTSPQPGTSAHAAIGTLTAASHPDETAVAGPLTLEETQRAALELLDQIDGHGNASTDIVSQRGTDPHDTAALLDFIMADSESHASSSQIAGTRSASPASSLRSPARLSIQGAASATPDATALARTSQGSVLPTHLAHNSTVSLGSQIANEVRSSLGGAPSSIHDRAALTLMTLLKRIASNDFESTPAKIGASVLNVGARNTMSVFCTTTVRQMISYGVAKGMSEGHVSDKARTLIALGIAALPIALLAAGGVRDRMQGTHNATSERSRMIMGLMGLTALVAGLATGQLGKSVELIATFTLYTAMRDLVVQSRVRLNNRHTTGTSPDAAHFLAISMIYGVDQFLVNLGMGNGASPSGPAAFAAGAGLQVGNAFKRGAINLAGEMTEDLSFQGIAAVRSGKALQLDINDEGYTVDRLKNAALAIWPTRSTILHTSILVSNIMAEALKDKPVAANYAQLAFYAGLNAVFYEPFANTGAARQPTASVETTLEDGSVHAAQADVYVSPNVDMTNEGSVLEAEARSLHEVTSGVADPDPRHRPSRDSLSSGDVQV